MKGTYRDLIAWQRAMDLAVEVYRITTLLPPDERFGLVFQLRKAAVSVPSNIAEGHGRGGAGEFAQHLGYSIASVREIETQLLLTVRLKQLHEDDVIVAMRLADEDGRLLAGLIRTVRGYRRQGNNDA